MGKHIILVSNEPDLREGLAPVLEEGTGLSCTTCVSGSEAMEYVRRHPPNVALVSLALPDMSGLDCTEQLKAILPDLEVIALYGDGESARVFEALRAGASGFLERGTDSKSVLEAVSEVLRGGVPMARDAARRLAQHFRTPVRQRLGLQETLSAREEEILKCLVQGYATKEIASTLSVSYDTVRTHLKHIYGKLQVRSRTEAVIKHLNGAV
jgi:DNA-binding NarL/FixJ family response regulator